MDWLLPLLAIVFVLSGTGLGAYLTYNFRKGNNDSQQRIEKLNQEIESVVAKSKALNDEILSITSNTKILTEEVQKITSNIQDTQIDLKKITSNTKELSDKNINLTEEIQQITNNIQLAQNDIKEITEKTKELADKNILLTGQSKALVEVLTNFQTGGESFCELGFICYEDDQVIELYAKVRGNNTMRNVKITIVDNIIEKTQREKFKVAKYIENKVERNSSRKININMGDMKPYYSYDLLFLDLNDYSSDIDFTIVVDSENFGTQQNLVAYEICDEQNVKRYSKVVGRGDKGGIILSENNYRFPINDKGIPVRKSEK